ncbi:hypothetical protein FACS1894152_4660 [Bacilli bacterium]|nr:hypothetical protein FACS1894152_4660 [Bacilli bacterium]
MLPLFRGLFVRKEKQTSEVFQHKLIANGEESESQSKIAVPKVKRRKVKYVWHISKNSIRVSNQADKQKELKSSAKKTTSSQYKLTEDEQKKLKYLSNNLQEIKILGAKCNKFKYLWHLPKNSIETGSQINEVEDYDKIIRPLPESIQQKMLEADESLIRALGIKIVSLRGMHPLESHEIVIGLLKTQKEYPTLIKSIECICYYGDRKTLEETLYSFYHSHALKLHGNGKPNVLEHELEELANRKTLEMVEKEISSLENRTNNDGLLATCLNSNSLYTLCDGTERKDIIGKSAIVFTNTKENYVDKYRSYLHNIQTKYHPEKAYGQVGNLIHELGHAMDNMLNIKNLPKIITLYNKNLPNLKEKLSEYAKKNIGEFIAEAWAEYKASPEPRPLAKEVGVIIDKEYKKFVRKLKRKK